MAQSDIDKILEDIRKRKERSGRKPAADIPAEQAVAVTQPEPEKHQRPEVKEDTISESGRRALSAFMNNSLPSEDKSDEKLDAEFEDSEYVSKKSEDYIDENYTKNITLSKLEKKFLSDFTTLSKNFKQCYGITYHQYLTQKRMEKAKELLCNSDMKINAIASAVGYSDVKYFRYLFKKYYGKSPKDFKYNS